MTVQVQVQVQEGFAPENTPPFPAAVTAEILQRDGVAGNEGVRTVLYYQLRHSAFQNPRGANRGGFALMPYGLLQWTHELIQHSRRSEFCQNMSHDNSAALEVAERPCRGRRIWGLCGCHDRRVTERPMALQARDNLVGEWWLFAHNRFLLFCNVVTQKRGVAHSSASTS